MVPGIRLFGEDVMNVKKLSPELIADWLHFFDDVAFCDHEKWHFCYCLEGFLSPEEHEGWLDQAARRKEAIELIEIGVMQGYLAYDGDAVVGWLNVNDKNNYRFISEMFKSINYQSDLDVKDKVKVAYCFLVDPDHRGEGIAKELLQIACKDAMAEGYQYMEAYPFADLAYDYQYRGPYKLYSDMGFIEVADLQYVKVLRKRL